MDETIRERLLRIEDDLLEAVADGPTAISAFNTTWSTLQADVDQAMRAQSLDSETIALTHATASSVALLADSFLHIHMKSEALTVSLKTDLEDILEQVRLTDASQVSLFPSQPPSSDTTHSRPDTSPCPPYLPFAFKWLLKNIHNPYPTEEIKEAISAKTGSSRETIDDWFIRARKKIGWNALCKRHHAKSRKDTLDAAYRFFVAPDPKRPLDGNLEYDFAAVLNSAKAMYSEKLLKSALAVKLDVVVKDMTPSDRVRRKEKQLEKQTRKLQAKDKARATSSYPSPDHSPSCSPDMSLPSAITDKSDHDTSLPEPVAGRKRRSSSSDSSHWTYEVPADRPNKRHRSDLTSSDAHCITGLPSPPSSSDESDVQSLSTPSKSPSSLSAATAPISSSAGRKRRLSDADARGAPKRPRNLPVGPRLHAVSDPLPMSSVLVEASAFDDWFKVNFDPPGSAAAENELASSSLEVELFDCSTLYPGDAVESVTQNRVEQLMAPVPQHVVLSGAVDLSLPPVETNQQDIGQVSFVTADEFDISCPSDFDLSKWPLPVDRNKDELPVGNVTDLMDKPFNFCSLAFDMPSGELQEGVLPTSFSQFHQTSDSAVIPVSSSDTTNNLDWLDPYFPFPNTEPQFYQSNDSQHRYEFDPTVFPFCESAITLSSHGDCHIQTEKAEKQRKLRELQEAARKLEEELSIV